MAKKFKVRKNYFAKAVKTESNKQLTKEVKTIQKRIKDIKPECKYILVRNTQFNPAVRTSVGALINPCARGTTVQTRIGDHIKPLYMKIDGMITWVQNAAGQNQLTTRMIVVYDREPSGQNLPFNAVAPAVDYLFQGAQGSLELHSMYNINETELSRFKILKDFSFSMKQGVNANGFAGTLTKRFRFNINLKSLPQMSYKGGTAGTIADITKGAIWFYLWNDAGTQIYYLFDSYFCYYDS